MNAEESDARVARLEQEVTSLRTTVEKLAGQLANAGERLGTSMRAHHRCPACGKRRILHATEIFDAEADRSNRQPMSVDVKVGFFSNKRLGQFEAYLCAGCGLVEWYVPNASALDTKSDHVRELPDPSNDDGSPYR